MAQKRVERRPAAILHRQERARAEAAAEEWRQSVVGQSGPGEAEGIALGVLPASETATSRLPNHRRARIAEHLEELIQETEKAPATRRAAGKRERIRPETEDDSPLLRQACATCRGHCCRTGGEQAYLGSADLLRFWSTRPRATGASIVKTYLSALPERSYTGSCVFHGTRGCTLPREMRADICNVFLCDGAQDLRAKLADEGTRGGFLVAAANGEPVRATLVAPDGTARRLRKR